MKSTVILGAAVCAVLGLTGCGGGGDHSTPIVGTQIISDPTYDGYIEQVGPNSFTVTQGMSTSTQVVYSGIDPKTNTELRAFLDFPLGGPGGVPTNAVIDSATLEVLIDDLQPVGTSLPLLVELVSFPRLTLAPGDFDRSLQPPLASVQATVREADVGQLVSIDVTPLMVQAQRMRLDDFQIRIMEDLGPAIGTFITIDDTTGSNRPKYAPILTVNYF